MIMWCMTKPCYDCIIIAVPLATLEKQHLYSVGASPSPEISRVSERDRECSAMAAAFTMRGVRVPPNSATLEEARSRMKDLFKSACRSLPAVMEIYNLHDVATISQLRSTIAAQIRKNANITNPKVIDMLVFKGMEELGNIVDHSKQRHHIIGQYVVGHHGLIQENTKEQGTSDFLRNFYTSNYF